MKEVTRKDQEGKTRKERWVEKERSGRKLAGRTIDFLGARRHKFFIAFVRKREKKKYRMS